MVVDLGLESFVGVVADEPVEGQPMLLIIVPGRFLDPVAGDDRPYDAMFSTARLSRAVVLHAVFLPLGV